MGTKTKAAPRKAKAAYTMRIAPGQGAQIDAIIRRAVKVRRIDAIPDASFAQQLQRIIALAEHEVSRAEEKMK